MHRSFNSSSQRCICTLGYYDDLMIYSGTSQNIYWSINGTAPNRQVIFEFYLSHITSSSKYFQFQILFFENQPDIVQYVYFESTDGGASATIGVQRRLLNFLSFQSNI